MKTAQWTNKTPLSGDLVNHRSRVFVFAPKWKQTMNTNKINRTDRNVKSRAGKCCRPTASSDSETSALRRLLTRCSVCASEVFTRLVPVTHQFNVATEVVETLDGIQVEGEVSVTLGSGTYSLLVSKNGPVWSVHTFQPCYPRIRSPYAS